VAIRRHDKKEYGRYNQDYRG